MGRLYYRLFVEPHCAIEGVQFLRITRKKGEPVLMLGRACKKALIQNVIVCINKNCLYACIIKFY